MKITRAQIIKAIKTEPLEGGQWINRTYDADGYISQLYWDRPADVQECKVCAVGAVLRSCVPGITPNRIIDFGSGLYYSDGGIGASATDIRQARDEVRDELALNNPNYILMLSRMFESYWRHYQDDRRQLGYTRKALVKFVQNNFPKSITVTL